MMLAHLRWRRRCVHSSRREGARAVDTCHRRRTLPIVIVRWGVREVRIFTHFWTFYWVARAELHSQSKLLALSSASLVRPDQVKVYLAKGRCYPATGAVRRHVTES